MFEGFESFSITTLQDPHVEIHGLKSGHADASRPGLLLLHGFPQTRHIWHRVAPQLGDEFNLVIPDLRGYGESSKPEGVNSYAKSAMAKDFVSVMEQLGIDSFYVCSHDRGARVAHKMCVDFPDKIKKVIFLDICPTLSMYAQTDRVFAEAYFHWFMLIQPFPLPETMISGNPRKVTEMFLKGRIGGGSRVFDDECFEIYQKMMEDPKGVHAMCNDYRAGATVDCEEAKRDLEQGRLIKCPVRVLWGSKGVIDECFNALEEWRAVTEGGVEVEGQAVENCGHYIPEDAPEIVVQTVKQFFTSS